MKASLKKYAKRYDVIFIVGGTAMASFAVQAEEAPWWVLSCVIVMREIFGFMALLSKDNDA